MCSLHWDLPYSIETVHINTRLRWSRSTTGNMLALHKDFQVSAVPGSVTVMLDLMRCLEQCFLHRTFAPRARLQVFGLCWLIRFMFMRSCLDVKLLESREPVQVGKTCNRGCIH